MSASGHDVDGCATRGAAEFSAGAVQVADKPLPMSDRGWRARIAASGPDLENGTMATPPMVPAGWYADPAGRHEYRYWDGASWTSGVADGGITANDPLEAPPPPGQQTTAESSPAQQATAEFSPTQQATAGHSPTQQATAGPVAPLPAGLSAATARG